MRRLTWLAPVLYMLFLMVPIYWLLTMSFKTTNEILGAFTLWPRNFTLDQYREILTNPVWYRGYINSIIYVSINTILSVAVALPAAYAFSRYRFLGDKHLFFWLLTNRMAPPAVFARLCERPSGLIFCDASALAVASSPRARACAMLSS